MEGEYQGHVKEGKMHGVGVCLYTDGARYTGDWKAGHKNGRGTCPGRAPRRPIADPGDSASAPIRTGTIAAGDADSW